MSQYAFPTPHSPYAPQQPVIYTGSSHSHHGHGGHTYGTPLRRTSSAGHAYTSTPAYAYSNVVLSPNAQYLNVPSTHNHNRSHSRHRHTSHGHHAHGHEHGHGHGYNANASYYTVPAPTYHHSSSGHHRSHSTSHRHPSHSRARSQSRYADPRAYDGDYYRGRTISFGDRVRGFFGMEPASNSYYNYGDSGRSRHNSFSGHRNHTTRTGPLIFGSTGYVDKHGREVDDRGRQIHRY